MNTCKSTVAIGVCLLGGATAQTTAQATIVDIVFGTPRQSIDVFGSAANETLVFNFGGPVLITGIGWDMTLETFGASLVSEASISFSEGATGPGAASLLTLTPGFGVNSSAPFPGMALSSGGIVEVADFGVADIFVASGVIQLEFFETVDTVVGADAAWNSTISVEFYVIPAPSSVSVLALGLVCLRRRRA